MPFRFKQFEIDDSRCGMKVGTDGVILGAWVSCADINHAIDVGCGSGLIALMIAQRCNARIDAIEIDKNACADARINFAASPWDDRIDLFEGSFNIFDSCRQTDLVVCNPPFFAEGERSPSSDRARARHEGSLNYNSLIDFACDRLTASGRLAFIYPYGREDEIIYKAEMSHLKLRRICHLRQTEAHPYIRTLYEFCRQDGSIITRHLTIRQADCRSYTPEIASLCKDFYLEL